MEASGKGEAEWEGQQRDELVTGRRGKKGERRGGGKEGSAFLGDSA